MTLRELAEAETAENTEEGEENPGHPIISIERTPDSTTKGKWRIITTKDLLKEAHEKVEKILVNKRMSTEAFEQYKDEPNFQQISTDPNVAAYLERYEISLVNAAQYGEHRTIVNPYRTKKRLIQITYDSETFPELAGNQVSPYSTNRIRTTKPTPVNTSDTSNANPQSNRGYQQAFHPSFHPNQSTQQQRPMSYVAAAAIASIGRTITPDTRKQPPKEVKDTTQCNNESLMDDKTVVTSGNTATTIGTNMAQLQEEMMKMIQSTFSSLTTSVKAAQEKAQLDNEAINTANVERQNRVN
jgi:hypothetical protein